MSVPGGQKHKQIIVLLMSPSFFKLSFKKSNSTNFSLCPWNLHENKKHGR